MKSKHNAWLIPRDAEDHIAWLLQHGWHEKALAAVEAGKGRSELLDEVFLSFDVVQFGGLTFTHIYIYNTHTHTHTHNVHV